MNGVTHRREDVQKARGILLLLLMSQSPARPVETGRIQAHFNALLHHRDMILDANVKLGGTGLDRAGDVATTTAAADSAAACSAIETLTEWGRAPSQPVRITMPDKTASNYAASVIGATSTHPHYAQLCMVVKLVFKVRVISSDDSSGGLLKHASDIQLDLEFLLYPHEYLA